MNPYEHWQRKLIEIHTRRNPIEFNMQKSAEIYGEWIYILLCGLFRLSSLYIIIYVFFCAAINMHLLLLFIYLGTGPELDPFVSGSEII